MGRSIALLLGLVMSAFVGLLPAADAIGGAVCTITGTMNFAPTSEGSTTGLWSIEPALIDCQGAVNGYHFLGPGSFTGVGSYTTTLPSGGGACLQHVGTGTVDYTVQTAAMDFHIRESKRFVIAGAGEFTTPRLRGSLQLGPPYDGDCVTRPVRRATFVAQALMARTAPFFIEENAY